MWHVTGRSESGLDPTCWEWELVSKLADYHPLGAFIIKKKTHISATNSGFPGGPHLPGPGSFRLSSIILPIAFFFWPSLFPYVLQSDLGSLIQPFSVMAIPNRGPELQAVCYTLLIASVIALGLRVYVRLRLVKNFGFDDWCMCCALVSSSLSNTHLIHLLTIQGHIFPILLFCAYGSPLWNRPSPRRPRPKRL